VFFLPFARKDRLPIWILPDDHPAKKQLQIFIGLYERTIVSIVRAFDTDFYKMKPVVYHGKNQDAWKYIFLILWAYKYERIARDDAKKILKEIFKRNYELEKDAIMKNEMMKAVIEFFGSGRGHTDLSKDVNLEKLTDTLLNFQLSAKINK
jgi:hypothetical protein